MSAYNSRSPRFQAMFRMALWVVAAMIGLWIGSLSRPTTAAAHASRPSIQTAAAAPRVAFDVLLTIQALLARP